MSSAGATRTSTGKLIRRSERSTSAFSSRSAVGRRLPRHRVLHLHEAHPARAGEDLVGDVGVGPGSDRRGWRSWRCPGRRPGSRRRPSGRRPRRRCWTGTRRRASLRNRGQRRGRALAAVVALGGAALGVREPVELEVLVLGRPARRTGRAPRRSASAPRARSAGRPAPRAKVIALTTPSAPRPSRAPANSSAFSVGEQVSTVPSASDQLQRR